jgi:putative ABC transport system permease protein
MPHVRFILRQIRHSGKQAVVFILCTMVSLTTLVALDGFRAGVSRSLFSDTRALLAADLVVESAYPLSAAVLHRLGELQEEGRIRFSRVYEFYAMVRTLDEKASIFSQIKVVAAGYPYYGQVVLASGRPFHSVLVQGSAIAERSLLDRLGVAVGDTIVLGEKKLSIADVVLREPDRPLSFFSLGPRLFVPASDLAALNLIGRGSRVRYRVLVKVTDRERVPAIEKILLKTAIAGRERVESFQSSGSRIRALFDNLMFFLGLIGIFTLLLAGIGIQSALSALLREKSQTIAVLKTLGADSQFIATQFVSLVMVLGLAGILLGLASGLALQAALPALMGGLVPAGMSPGYPWRALIQGTVLGVCVIGLFTFLPLYRLKAVRPVSILKREPPELRGDAPFLVVLGGIGLFFIAMILWQLGEVRVGLEITGATAVLILLITGSAAIALRGLQKVRTANLVLRQALRGLFRAGNATIAIMVTLAAALTLLFSLYLVEENLNASFIASYPPDSPNLYFLNIQASQQQAVAKMLGGAARFYPVVRARLTAVNGRQIDEKAQRSRRGDNLARPFNLTYRDHLLEDERIEKGQGLFSRQMEGAQVSVLDRVTKMKPMTIGDRLTFNIQGVPLSARISSIRTRTKDAFKPFFYFVFQRETLKRAPQTIFAALRVDPSRIGRLQQEVVSRYPNVSVIDLTQAIERFSRIMAYFSRVVRFFAAFSLLAGMLILVGSVFATRGARVREAVYFKLLGARSRFVVAVFAAENLIIGLVSSLTGLILSYIVAWQVCSRYLDIDFNACYLAGIWMVAGTLSLVITVGLLSCLGILRQRPVHYLRMQPD